MRLVTTGQVSLDVEPSHYHDLLCALQELLKPHMEDMVKEYLGETISDKLVNAVLERLDESRIAYLITNRGDFYPNFITTNGRAITANLLEDERFNSRMMRRISDATIGVTNEAVERITAIIEAKTNNNSDV